MLILMPLGSVPKFQSFRAGSGFRSLKWRAVSGHAYLKEREVSCSCRVAMGT
jgi:hypothetical protein